MTRTGEQVVSTTPFARVLTHFMWSKTPPWSAAKTAAVLGIHRTRVANWVYRGIMPELDTMLVVMAKLGIPLRELLDAYTADGIPVPTIEPEEDAGAPTRARAASYAVPGRGRERAATAATAEPQAQQAQQEPQTQQSQLAIEAQEKPQQAQEPPATRPTAQETRDAEWEKMLAHTREVMALAGMGETAIEALLSNLKDTRDGKPTEAQRRIAEEHQSSKPSKPSRPSSSRSSRSSRSSQSSQSSARAGQAGDEKPRQSPARSASPENSAYLPTER